MSGDKPAKGPTAKKKALGRGLAALLGDDLPPGSKLPTEPHPGEKIIDLPVERVEPNPFQPRREYEPLALKSLAHSIAEHGVLQPLVVRLASGGYQLIAGERRLRACQMAGLTSVPVVVRQADDQQALVLALLENLQREDLNPMEEARAFRRLAVDFDFTQEDIALGVGKERSTVTNTLRLLKLPPSLQEDIAANRISAGHGRALLQLSTEAQAREVGDMIIARDLSVRAVEKVIKNLRRPNPLPSEPSQEEVYIRDLAGRMQSRLGTKVGIVRKGKKGRINIEFYSDEDLERLIEILV